MLNMKYETRKYEIHNTQHATTTQDPRPKIFKNFARVLLGPHKIPYLGPLVLKF